MTELHVVPDPRTGTWRVQDGEHAEPSSEHTNATEAESAAWRRAGRMQVERIVIHDRYARTREIMRRGYSRLQRRG